MALYEDETKVRKTGKPEIYKKSLNIGIKPANPGIYKCDTCGFEDVINRECDKLPPCSKCRDNKRSNTWKLLVTATEK